MNKQIEEMAETTMKHCEMDNQCGSCHWSTCNECLSEVLYNAGYRKQEWISVEERLPKRMETVLVCVKGYLKKPIMVVSEMLEENGARWSACAGFTVTHWMPLPEPPKGE